MTSPCRFPARARPLWASLLLLAVLFLVLPTARPAALATAGPTPSTAVPPHTVLPPYESPGEDIAPPQRTRQDRIVSTIAPIGMVAVLVAGLYVYWLIRKGL